MLTKLTEEHRRLLGNSILVVLALMLLGSIVGTVLRVNESINSERDRLVASGQRLADSLDHELDIHVYNVMAMDYVADRFFSGRLLGLENPVPRLVTVPERGGYKSILPDSFGTPTRAGRITGFGPIPFASDPAAAEMVMAVGLTPLMRAIRDRSPDVPWVQYTSARGFMFLFPQEGADSFHFRSELMKRDYFARATPQANPQRKVFWSRPYQDAAGKGTLVTVTKPVYAGDIFKGSVSIDVTVASLQRVLDRNPLRSTQFVLLGDDKQEITRSTASSDDEGDHAHNVVSLPLHSAPWTLALNINRGDLVGAALAGRLWHITAVVVLALTLFFLFLLMRSARQVRELSIRDGLTGLYNRRHFDTLARQQFELARRSPMHFGLAILDIDFFRKYNDHYGHQQGDVALRAVAQALKTALRRASDQVFRVGGEEFAVLVALTDASEMEPLMQQLNQAVRDIQQPHAFNPSGHVTVSIGATVISRAHWLDMESAYKRADEMLYTAKTTGRDRAVIDEKAKP